MMPNMTELVAKNETEVGQIYQEIGNPIEYKPINCEEKRSEQATDLTMVLLENYSR